VGGANPTCAPADRPLDADRTPAKLSFPFDPRPVENLHPLPARGGVYLPGTQRMLDRTGSLVYNLKT